MTEQTITRDTLIIKALQTVPSAVELFYKHGVDPSASCGVLPEITRLEEAQSACNLCDLDALINELNAELRS